MSYHDESKEIRNNKDILGLMYLVTENAHHYKCNTSLNITYEEFKSEGFVRLCESLSRYSSEKGVLPYHYSKKRVEGSMVDLIRQELRRTKRKELMNYRVKETKATPPLIRMPLRSIESEILLRQFVDFFSKTSDFLDEEEENLINYYFFKEISLAEIASIYKTNRYDIFRKINRIKEKLASLFIIYKKDLIKKKEVVKQL